jgi:hypothetical protein
MKKNKIHLTNLQDKSERIRKWVIHYDTLHHNSQAAEGILTYSDAPHLGDRQLFFDFAKIILRKGGHI